MTAQSSESTAMNRRRWLGLTLLIVANCLLLGMSEWSLALLLPLDGTPRTQIWVRLLGNVSDGILTAQFLCLGFWCALAPERLVVRLVAGIALAPLLLGIYLFFIATVSGSQALSASDEQAGSYCGQALIAFLLLRALRPWCGWRLAWEASPPPVFGRQFRILDLLAWTTAAAVPLGMLQTFYGARSARLALFSAATFAVTLPVMIPAFRWAIHPRKDRRWLIGTILWGPAWSALLICCVNASMYLLRGRGGLPFWKESLLVFAIWSASYLALVLVTVGNVLALEKLGLRVARPEPRSR